MNQRRQFPSCRAAFRFSGGVLYRSFHLSISEKWRCASCQSKAYEPNQTMPAVARKGTYCEPIRPSDLQVLELIHASLFPVRYDIDFFLNVVNGLGIVSWGAVDVSRSDGHIDELIGFVTTRIIAVKASEIENLLRYDTTRNDQTLVYILTLGVVEQYRNLGIASSLVREVIKYASSISSCRAVYLHVIAYNQPAIHFYQKMLFKLVRRLSKFYYINGYHYDAFLFLYYVNGGQSPCSMREVLAAVAAYLRGLLSILAGKIWNGDCKRKPRWYRCKENNSHLVAQSKRILNGDNAIC